MVLSDTRIKEDHNFWNEIRPKAWAAVGPGQAAGGVAILSFGKHIRFSDVTSDTTGRLLGVTVEGGEEPFRLVAAYLPAQACNRAKFHKEHLEPFVLAQPQSKHMVLVGDLNMIADPDLDKSSGVGSGRENQRFLEAWRTHDLRDAFRVLHPTEREYTFKDRASQSKTRIDRAMVSMSLLGNLEGVRHVAVPRNLTDHWFAVKIRLKFTSTLTYGPGLWRFHATRGKRRGVRKVIQEVVEGLSKAGKVSLEQVLPKLTAVLRAHEKEERKRVLATQRHLTEEVERLRHMIMGGPTDDKTKALLLSREEQLEAYRENERERLEVFAGLAAELEGEIPSPHLSAQVKMRKDRTLIEEVQFKGSCRRGSQAVLSAASEYFAEAFKAEAAGSQPSGLNIQMDRKLPGEAADRLKAPWTELEVKAALDGLPKGKLPGQDGLPAELFIGHWDLLKNSFMGLVRKFDETGKLPDSLTTAVTVLLHKKGEKDLLTNYRPISLLTTVYKVLAKVLANRLKQELHLIISKEQHGFIPGRSLADAVAVVADAIEAADNDGEDWYLLLVDFQKAYDTVSRDFLFKTLEKLGLPAQFVGWTEGLHRGAGTKMAVNGWIGEKVEMQRGVRQGCPLAPYLFLCALEPLCAEIKRRGLGVKAEEGEAVSYVGYADDTLLILKGADQLREAAEALEWFGELSRLRINRDKSIVMPLGRNKGKTSLPGITFKWAMEGVPERLLGVWVTPNGDASPSWEKAWERGRRELVKWESKHLLTASRVTVINSYIMPIFLFQAQIYPPPEELWGKIRKTCDNYVSKGEVTAEKIFVLWSGELTRLPKKKGGLGLIDPKERLDSLVIRQVGKFLTEQDTTKRWLTEKAAAMPQGVASLFAHKSAGKHWEKGSQRWKAIAEVFWESPFADLPAPSSSWEVERELLCFNRHIMYRGGSPFGNQKGTSGILKTRMGDLLTIKEDGSRDIKDVKTLAREFGSVVPARWAEKAFEAAPAEWKALLRAPRTAEAVVAAAKVVRTVLARTQEFLYWTVKEAKDGEVVMEDIRCSDGLNLVVPPRPVVAAFSAKRTEPVAIKGGTVLGAMGEPRAKLCQTLLVGDNMRPAAPREIRRVLAGPAGTSRRRHEWDEELGRKIDWKAVRERRDSLAIPYRARDVVLRMHTKNLQVGGRLVCLGSRGNCPHCGGPETLDHCMRTCPVIQPVIGALLCSLEMINPTDRTSSLGDMLFSEGATKSGDERAAIARISEAGVQATWKVEFLSVWQNPKTFHRPP
ncbi:unnamed protein product [Closterium sp. NIES-65]|nr:unnamed protein product [Closterium sp. NIES-65]